MQAATVFLVVLPVSAALWAKSHPNPNDRIVNPLVPPMSMAQEGGGPSSPFFPSSAKTNVGGVIPSNFFMDSELCGECHKDVYEQWKGSVHHFASFNNQFYRKSIEYMQDTVGTQPSKWIDMSRQTVPCLSRVLILIRVAAGAGASGFGAPSSAP